MREDLDDPGLAVEFEKRKRGLLGLDFSKSTPGLAGATVQAGATYGFTVDVGASTTAFLSEAAKALAEVRKIKPESVPAEAAFLLVLQAATRAFDALFPEPDRCPVGVSKTIIQNRVGERDWRLYKNPWRIEFLEDIQTLPGCYRFADYFVAELEALLKTDSDIRRTLTDYVSHLLSASQQAHRWIEHDAAAIREVEQDSLLGEKCTLAQLFVEPLAHPVDDNNTIVDLWAKELPEWIDADTGEDYLRLIYGGPGAGKSSLTRMLAARIAQGAFGLKTRCRVVRVPIHELGEPASGEWDEFSLRRRLHKLADKFVPFDVGDDGALPRAGAERLVLLLDGLDELETLGGQARQWATDLFKTLVALLRDWNADGRQTIALITGRDPSLQALSQKGRATKPIRYRLLPFPVDTDELPKGRHHSGRVVA